MADMRLSPLNLFFRSELFVQEAYKMCLSFFIGEKKTPSFKKKNAGADGLRPKSKMKYVFFLFQEKSDVLKGWV